MTLWWIFAAVSGLGLATRNIAFKLAGQKLDVSMAALILSVAMTLTTLAYFLYERYATSTPKAEFSNMPASGVLFAVLSGIGVSAANILLAYAFKAGAPSGLAAVIQNACAISLTLLIGILVLNESVRAMQFVGVAVAFLGIVLIVRGR